MKYERAISEDVGSEDQVLLRLIGSPDRVLEVGCSTGYFSAELQRRGVDVQAVDLDEVSVARAVERGIAATRLDVEQPGAIQTLRGPFDVVLMANVVEHLRNPTDVLRDVRGVLGPDGRLLVSVPNVAHVGVRRSLALGRFNYTEAGILDTTHLRFYTRATLRSTLEEAGWRVTREALSPGLLAPTIKARLVRALAPRLPCLLAVHLIAEAQPHRDKHPAPAGAELATSRRPSRHPA